MVLSSCAHVISQEIVQSSMKEIGFSRIAKSPDSYMNNTFILGGTIVGTTETRQGTEIEIIQNPIDQQGSIIDRDISEGRFIVESQGHLDPMIYKQDRLVTVAGKLVASRKKTIGEMEYLYPVLEAKEIYLWREERYYQPYPYMYDPSYYRYYFYDPFWYRPILYP
jgi:outer membrane lipoprotein